MNERPEPPPEGRLITAALKRTTPKMSAREAARRAGMSEGRWRQITQGYQTISGRHAPLTGPPETLARMAAVVGVTAEQLAEAGREDAAQVLRDSAGDPDRPAPKTWKELSELMDADPEFEEAILNVARTMLRMRGPSSEERDVG